MDYFWGTFLFTGLHQCYVDYFWGTFLFTGLHQCYVDHFGARSCSLNCISVMWRVCNWKGGYAVAMKKEEEGN